MMRFLLPLLLLLIACGDDDPDMPVTPPGPVNATALLLTVSGPNGAETFAYRTDVDIPAGETPDPPVVDDIVLDANTNYTYTLRYEEETVSIGTRSVTSDIEEMGTEYVVLTEVLSAGLTFTPNDTDANGAAIGLSGTLNTAGPSAGVLRVDLRYEIDKDNPSATGERLLRAEYSVSIE